MDIVHREADVALRLGEPTQPDLIARRLVKVGFGLYASDAYLRGAPPLDALEDLEAHQLVGLDATGVGFDYAHTFPVQHALPGTYVYISNSPAAQMAAVRAGFGIGVLSHRWAALSGDLTRLLPDYNAAELDLWLVTHEELRHSARIRATYDYIAERMLADASLFQHGMPAQASG
ncbi:MAG: LysR substrate-binding domain-containing protein [Halioglobus sp.]|nr:LysR substrate-binding domain-containing protein [Halioglobus sp.]